MARDYRLCQKNYKFRDQVLEIPEHHGKFCYTYCTELKRKVIGKRKKPYRSKDCKRIAVDVMDPSNPEVHMKFEHHKVCSPQGLTPCR